MRRAVIIFILINLAVVLYLVHQVSTLISLLLEDASTDAILRSELPAPNSSLLENRPQRIPKIIHQTYISEDIPARWREPQQSCIDLHPDYVYILWTDEKSHDFISTEYPWFLGTFESYSYPIQRADAIRYFVLAHYGGVYLDLDQGCRRRLDPLLSYTAFLRRTIPTGISNDIMGSIPQHPFFLRVTDALPEANRAWFLPYITIMASTGPLFLSVMWKNWMNEHADPSLYPADWRGRVRVLMPDETAKHPWSFFNAFVGSSWHGGDARLIFWMGRHWLLLTVAGFAIAGLVGLALYLLYGCLLLRLGHQPPYHVRRKSAGSSPGGTPRPRALERSHASSSAGFWRRFASVLVRGPGGGKGTYELVDQDHDA